MIWLIFQIKFVLGSIQKTVNSSIVSRLDHLVMIVTIVGLSHKIQQVDKETYIGTKKTRFIGEYVDTSMSTTIGLDQDDVLGSWNVDWPSVQI